MTAQPADATGEHETTVLPGGNWEAQRREILARVLDTLGPFPTERCPLDMHVSRDERDASYPTVERRHVRFRSERDDWITGYLCVPLDKKPPLAAVVCFHPTTTG